MIEVKNLTYKIKNTTILDSINLLIEDGDFLSIIGPNGAGKSTLLKIILGLKVDFSGEILIDNIKNLQWLKQNNLGYVPQRESFDIDFPATVLDIVLMGLVKNKLFFSREDKNKCIEALEHVGLGNYSKRLIGQLSGGEFQKVLLARSMVSNSNYLFFDEPEANVDLTGVSNFYKILKEQNKLGKTIVVISHDIQLATKYSTKIACLNKSLHFHNNPRAITSEILSSTFGNSMKYMEPHHV